MRRILVLMHRYAGLVTALFLLIASLTGSLMAWNDELETLISPQLFLAKPPAPGAAMLDPLQLIWCRRSTARPSCRACS
jgi:uncharacterized iron-regulated membrane protein